MDLKTTLLKLSQGYLHQVGNTSEDSIETSVRFNAKAAIFSKLCEEDIQEIIKHNVQGLLGMLPSDQFDVKITSSKDNIANLLSSAMMTGYFLRQMEQRKELEQTLINDENMSVDID